MTPKLIKTLLARLAGWWKHVSPPILSVLMLLFLAQPSHFYQQIWLLPYFGLLSLLSALLGYFINDWTDIIPDRQAGKRNSAAGISPPLRWVLLLALLAGCLAIWFKINAIQSISFYIWLALMCCFGLYSVPPFRFKERPVLGLLCDSLYTHVLPIGITISLFMPQNEGFFQRGEVILAAIILTSTLFIKGLRNILIHQIEDRHNDRRSGTHTFVTQLGALNSAQFINKIVVPAEVYSVFLLLSFLSLISLAPLIAYVLFLGFTALLFSAWKFQFLPYRQLLFKLWYFMNDFYEEWLPCSLALGISIKFPQYWYVLPLFWALFPHILVNAWADLKKIALNLREGLQNDWK